MGALKPQQNDRVAPKAGTQMTFWTTEWSKNTALTVHVPIGNPHGTHF